ncbi:MAG TPA: DegT/DnrJ/EryC1/StrS family aminotransferase [Acidimicrobiia bacterium]
MESLPAILGSEPAFDPPLPFARPTIEERGNLTKRLGEILESGRLTDGPVTRQLEERVREAFHVDHCIAVSSATTGLMILIQALDPGGPVLVPSFTFAATADAVAWNGLPILFADCSPETWCLRPDDIYGQPAMVLAVHVSGVPCDVDGLQRAADRLGAPLIYDAAHGAGSLVHIDGRSMPLGGFGRAEVFSLTPTKVMNGAEGGLITTNDSDLADRLRIARNYGNPGNYDTVFPGLNARLSELHAAVALHSLDHLEEWSQQRNTIATRYRHGLGSLPGLSFQQVPPGSRSSFKDFTTLVDGSVFGCSRRALTAALAAEGVPTRHYYSPPLHRQKAFRAQTTKDLPVTDRLARQVLTLPIWSHLSMNQVDQIVDVVASIQAHAERIETIHLVGDR